MAAQELVTIPYRWTEGDQEPNGEVDWGIDVTGHTSELHLTQPGGTAVIVTGAILGPPADGVFEYAWGPADLVAGEGQLVRARLINGSSERKTVRYLINVDEDGAAP